MVRIDLSNVLEVPQTNRATLDGVRPTFVGDASQIDGDV
jgi:hypothetical protein